MSVTFRITEILKATGGVLLHGPREATVEGISIDSRNFKKGNMFIAIRGVRHDGHRFIKDVEGKAAALLVSRKNISTKRDIALIYVPDTVKALGDIARFHRRRFRIPVIAITGSNGKTTTKEILAALLRTKYNCLSNIGTQNNHIGVPLTLLRLNRTHEIVILEFGTNRFGDIRWLTRISEPDVAVYTTIGESHLEGLKDPEGVLCEKLDLARFMNPHGQVIVNQDNPYLASLSSTDIQQKIITYGIEHHAHYQATDCEGIKNNALGFRVNGQGPQMTIRTITGENILNALAALACARLFHISYPAIQDVLHRFRFPQGRQIVKRLHGLWLIDDTYNANPLSFRSAIATLNHLQSRGKKILVCGDMLELGRKTVALHRQIGQWVAQADIDKVFTTGKFSKFISQTVGTQNPQATAVHVNSLSSLHQKLKRTCQAGDTILVKGSRGMHMERTVDFLSRAFSHNHTR